MLSGSRELLSLQYNICQSVLLFCVYFFKCRPLTDSFKAFYFQLELLLASAFHRPIKQHKLTAKTFSNQQC